jgi:3-deoxy-D-manno-octulosonic acid (KDO) 8-phosphate synthase
MLQGEPAPPSPQRIQPEPPPAGMIEATFMATQNLSRVMGVFDPAVRGGAQHKSDKTLNAERGQSEMTNFDGYDNLVRSIKHTWRIMLSWFPTVYDVQRSQRIIGEDGRDSLVTLNERVQSRAPMVRPLKRC